jgi:tetratricopeptide (TPR) repeat protein
MHAFGTKDLVGLVGISRSRIRALIRAGHVRPGRGRRGELRFSFQDVIILRTAKALAAASIPLRRINQSLRQLQASLPPEVPLSGLSITSIGDRIAVREGLQQREIDSGQYVLALSIVNEGGEVRIIDQISRATAKGARSSSKGRSGAGKRPGASGSDTSAIAAGDAGSHRGAADERDSHALYLAACSLEDEDPAAAIAAYSRSLAADPDHYEARLNLGRLLHLAGRLTEAERIYRAARRYDATLLFNLGVLLEDMERASEAISTYREALDLDATFADAHFNLARLYEREHNRRETLRHLLAYRRLTR